MLRPGWPLRTTFLTWQIRDLASSVANVGICAIKWYSLFFHFNVITFSHFFFCPLVTVTECCFDLQNQQLMSLNATWKKNTLEKAKENCDFYYKSCLRIPNFYLCTSTNARHCFTPWESNAFISPWHPVSSHAGCVFHRGSTGNKVWFVIQNRC